MIQFRLPNARFRLIRRSITQGRGLGNKPSMNPETMKLIDPIRRLKIGIYLPFLNFPIGLPCLFFLEVQDDLAVVGPVICVIPLEHVTQPHFVLPNSCISSPLQYLGQVRLEVGLARIECQQ